MRYFQNRLPDFIPGGAQIHVDAALWKGRIFEMAESILNGMRPKPSSCDGGLYVGCAGVGYAFSRVSNSPSIIDLSDQRQNFLKAAKSYVDVSLEHAKKKGKQDPAAGFLLGRCGVDFAACLVYRSLGDEQTASKHSERYAAVGVACTQKGDYLKCGSDELLVGRAGYLCGALALKKALGQPVLKTEALIAICREIVESGRSYSKRHHSRVPLMFAYYDTEYLGAAHGLSSILQMLLSCPEFLKSDPSTERDIRLSVEFMLGLMQPNGNIAPAMDEVEARGHRRSEDEELVHWCHGAPGVVYLFARAYVLWKEDKYLEACLHCGELTWQKGLLRKGPGICHGVAGSGYVFLLLYRLTGDNKHLHRAIQFAEFMYTDEFRKGAHTPDAPFSLYEGWAGTLCFLSDILLPSVAEFPFFDVFG